MFLKLSSATEERILRDREKGVFYGTADSDALRPDANKDVRTVIRPAYVRDIAKIINLPIYSRLQDKTQVLSLIHNDDISRRMLHVQLVSRIARDISRALNLNTDLTEAIALGHDLGHTPFGHAGERMLDELMREYAGLRFFHNVQSARALTLLYPCNLSLQTLDGILTHNGEIVHSEYRPAPLGDFDGLYARIADCEKTGEEAVKKLVPGTIEGCVVRISDIIAYLGKDRQDAARVGIAGETDYSDGMKNAEIINNLTVDIVEHSYGKGYIALSKVYYDMLERAKRENYDMIYSSDRVSAVYGDITPIFRELFALIVDDAKSKDGFTYRAHVQPILEYSPRYAEETPVRIACDFIASMTDDYFLALYKHLTGKDAGIPYKQYFA